MVREDCKDSKLAGISRGDKVSFNYYYRRCGKKVIGYVDAISRKLIKVGNEKRINKIYHCRWYRVERIEYLKKLEDSD